MVLTNMVVLLVVLALMLIGELLEAIANSKSLDIVLWTTILIWDLYVLYLAVFVGVV